MSLESLVEHCRYEDGEERGGQYTTLLDPICNTGRFRDFPSNTNIRHHSAVCRASIIVVNFCGRTYFFSSCHSPALPTVSNALLKSTNTMYSIRSCSLHFSCSCRRQNITFTVLRLPLKPHCVSGTTSGVTWVDSLLRRILAKILPAMERREIPQSVRSLFLYMVTMLIHRWILIEACLCNALRDVVHCFLIYVARDVE